MSRRALSLAAAMLWMSALGPAAAQNLEAGKSPAQIFAATCAVCHKGPHGLLKSVTPGALPGFLRQHYTTSTNMAAAMSAYVLSNGAANRRTGDGHLTREGRELSAPKPREPEAEPRERQERRIGTEKPASGHAAKPKEEGSSEADVKDKKPKTDRRKPKTVPPKDEPKATSQPEAPAAAPASPAEPAAQPESKPAAPAPEEPAKKPASNMPVFNIEPKADTAPAAPAPDKPAEPAPAGAPAAQ